MRPIGTGGVAHGGGQVVYVGGCGCAGGARDPVDNRGVRDHPDEGGGRASQRNSAKQHPDDGRAAGEQGGDPPPYDHPEAPRNAM